MRSLNRILWTAAIAAGFSGGAYAQTTTTTTGSTGGGTGGGMSGAGTSGGGPAGTASNLATQQAPAIVAPSQSNTTNSALATSNAFNKYYANPSYQGRAGTTGGTSGASSNVPGGFGAPLYGTTGTTAGSTSGGRTATNGATARNAGTTTGSTAGIGGTGTAATTTGARGQQQGGLQQNTQGGFRGTTQQNQQNNGLTTGRQISYTATLKFAAPSVPVAQMQTDLRGMIDASSSIADAKGISVTAAEGGVIVLRGNAKDEDEAKLIEGMIRLTPGVKQVQNELKFPVQ